MNGGKIKIKGQKKVTYITHMVVMHITFLIVEDVLNPIIGLDALHQNSVQFHLFQTGKAYLQQKSQKAVLHYHKHHYYASGLVLSGYVKSSILKWDDPQHTIFDPQSTSQIIAEIDFELSSEARLTQTQEEEDVSLESQRPQCLKIPESVTAAEREAHSLTHVPFRSWCTVCQRAKGQHQHHKGNQKITSVIQLDHSFYKVPRETQNLKVLTFVETVTSMSGAVIVPDLSANQVAIKTLKKFIAVNGFTKSVLQCDGHSGLLALQEQVGQEMSLPTQISPPYSHQSQGTVERFHKTLYGQVRSIRIGLADQLKIDADHLDVGFVPWIIQHATFQINRFLVRSDGKISFEKVFKKPQRSPIVHFGERVLAHIQSQPPAQKLQIRVSPQKSFGLWLGKDVITGMHIVTLMDGQILKTRTVTRLTREDQLKLEELKKFKIALHESSVVHKEDSYDQMLFKDLVRKLLLQQRNQVTFESSESDSRVTHSPDPLQESSAQGASSVPSAEGASSSDHHGIPRPPGFSHLIRRRITGKQPPSEFEINMINSLKQGVLALGDQRILCQ